MKKIVPFKKKLFFNNNISEILSISLEHNLHHENNYLISGEFILAGEYKVTESSTYSEKFDFKVPFDINVDEKYIMDKVTIDIDDFYYEIVNSNALLINIDVVIDKLEEKEDRISLDEVLNESEEDIKQFFTDAKEDIVKQVDNHKEHLQDIYEEKKEEVEEIKDNFKNNIKEYAMEKINNIVDDIKDFVTYRVYILKEGDTIETITSKYNIDKELLEEYNNLIDLKIGDKIIIPTNG